MLTNILFIVRDCDSVTAPLGGAAAIGISRVFIQTRS